MSMKRHEFLERMGALGVGAMASGSGLTLLDPEAAFASRSRPHAGQTLTVITQNGPPIASAATAAAAPFEKLTGAKVKVITAPFSALYTKTLAEFVSGGGTYDVILGPSSWLGDYSPYVVDLTDMIHKDKSLKWNDVIYQRNGQWAGRQIAIPVDGDNQLMYYRRDILSDKSLSAAYNRFFGDGKHGIHGVAEAYRHGGQAFWYYMSNCVAHCTVPGQKGGLFFDPKDLNPLINDPGHVEGLKNYVEAVKYGPPGMINWDSNEVRQQFKNGATVLGIDWDDTPIIGELEKGTKVKGEIGTALLPGTKRVWNYKTGKWQNMPTLNRPAWLAFGGWAGTIPKTSHNVELAYKYLSFVASPAFSLKMVTGANTGMNPYRFSHFTNVNAWKKVGYPEPDLNLYLAAMKKSDLDPHAVQDLRMPGAASFQDAVEVGAGKAVSGQSSPKAALDGIASAWNQINSQKGTSKQLTAYRASLNIGATR
ncbi:MAG: extracellular solute-binding protein [Actinobacteria bacterium]|nr:MAG: extracellular solute-binding protein [Actinomycetota bacterium]